MNNQKRVIVFLGLAAGMAISVSAQTVSVRPVATTLDEVPGVPSSRDFYNFKSSEVFIDQSGSVIFAARTSEVNSTFETGVWAEVSPGLLELVLMAGVQVSDQDPGVTFSNLTLEGLSSAGVAIIDGRLDGPGIDSSNNETLWIGEVGAAPQLLVREGQTQLAGSLDVTSFSFAAYSDIEMKTVIHSSLSGPGVVFENSSARWSIDSSGTIQILTRRSDPAPEFGPGVFYAGARSTPTAGVDAYIPVGVYGSGIDRVDDAVMLVPASGAPGTIVLRAGDPVQGHPGLTHDNVYKFTFAGTNAVFFSVFGDGSPLVAGHGVVYVNPDAGPTLVAATGDPVVGGAIGDTYDFDDAVYVPFVHNLDVSENGTAVFTASTALGSTGLWSYHPDSGIQSIAITGDLAPTSSGSYTFTNFMTSAPIINANGQVVFHAEAVDGSGTSTINGVWATTPGGGIVPVLVTGESVDVSTTGTPNLQSITDVALYQDSTNGGHERSPMSSILNNSGELVLTASFTGGSGVFVARITHCLADTNHDGVVSPADFSAWVAAFNAQAPECDQNGDGSCTPADFSAWVANYNAGC